jgi:hypothetical protein
LQLLAIKALQGASMPLGEIQARLYGRSDSELEAILAAATSPGRARPLAVNVWHEVVVEPGLKLVAEEGWRSSHQPAELAEKIRAAIAALQKSPSSPAPNEKNGGRHGR